MCAALCIAGRKGLLNLLRQRQAELRAVLKAFPNLRVIIHPTDPLQVADAQPLPSVGWLKFVLIIFDVCCCAATHRRCR
jgi:hypothetical protein